MIELARHLLEGAQTFDTRVWVAAVAVVMGTLLILAIGTCYLLYKDCHFISCKYPNYFLHIVVPAVSRCLKFNLEEKLMCLHVVILYIS